MCSLNKVRHNLKNRKFRSTYREDREKGRKMRESRKNLKDGQLKHRLYLLICISTTRTKAKIFGAGAPSKIEIR